MTSTKGSDTLGQARELARPAIERICSEVWELAELSLHEVESARVHRRELEAAGFTLVSEGTAGVPTAFIAEWWMPCSSRRPTSR
jgi:aminobenzoyl-glutamate utilization protein B